MIRACVRLRVRVGGRVRTGIRDRDRVRVRDSATTFKAIDIVRLMVNGKGLNCVQGHCRCQAKIRATDP